jgi:histidine phosphotransferase ChpT
MVTTVKLLELMSARIFHDLAGPIGAINNSVDFFEDNNPIIKEKAMQLMKNSSNESILRLKFFRQAYGSIHDTEVHPNIIVKLVEEFIQNKIKLKWDSPVEHISGYLGKVILNFAIIATNAVIRGGVMSVACQNNLLIISLQGQDIIFTDEAKLLLEGDTSINLTSTNVQIYYTHLMIEQSRAKLSINHNKNELQFMISY